MGHHRADPLGYCMDNRRGDSRLQRPTVTHQRSVCELVYVRAERCLLALYELWTVPEFETEDVFDRGERGVFLSRGYYCEFDSLLVNFWRGFLESKLMTLVVVWIRTVFVRDGDQQGRYKLTGKLLVRGQFKNLGLRLCHFQIVMRIHLSLLTWSLGVLREGIIRSDLI